MKNNFGEYFLLIFAMFFGLGAGGAVFSHYFPDRSLQIEYDKMKEIKIHYYMRKLEQCEYQINKPIVIQSKEKTK